MRIELKPCRALISDELGNYLMADSLVQDSEGSSSVTVDANERSSISMFDALKAPVLSDLTRKRRVHCNPPPKGKHRARGEGSSEPKNVTATQRVKEFSEECLEVTGTGTGKSKLFCKACREELSLKKNIIVSHVSSAKHKTGKVKLASKEAKERDIAQLIREGDVTHPVGETVPMDERVYRVKVLKCFLRAAVPIAKIEYFRDLLEENSFRSLAYERSYSFTCIPRAG